MNNLQKTESELSIEVNARETHDRAVNYFGISEKYAYSFVMEMKNMRDGKLFKQLNFETFDQYCNKFWGRGSAWMNEKIVAATKLSQEDFEDYNLRFGQSKTYLLATLDEDERSKAVNEGITSRDVTKDVSETSVREMEEYKRKLREEKERSKNLKNKLDIESSKEPETIIKEIVKEIIPKDILQKNHQLQETTEATVRDLRRVEKENKEMKDRLKREGMEKEEFERVKRNVDQLSKERVALDQDIRDVESIIGYIIEIDQLTSESLAPITYAQAIRRQADNGELIKRLDESVTLVEQWAKDVRSTMNVNGQIIEGGKIKWTF